MQKKTYQNTNLTCSLQKSEDIQESECLSGVISKTEDGFRFEESVKRNTDKRNPKLFDGSYCSLVHMQNGKYQIHMKTINASNVNDPNDYAFKVYSELLTAFNIIQ